MTENRPSILKKEENTIYDKYASLLVKDRIRNTEKEELEQIIKKDGETIEMMEYIYEKQKNILHKENEELKKENERLKSQYKVLRTQFQDLRKFVENNLNEYWIREKLNEQIIKLSDENEYLKKENEELKKAMLYKESRELKKEKQELCKYDCKVKAFEEVSEVFLKNEVSRVEHNDD